MSSDIQMAQVAAGEQAVVDRLRAKGLLPPDHTAEYPRLQIAVVEAAKVYCRNRGYGPAERSLMASVDALIAFEAKHKIGETDA